MDLLVFLFLFIVALDVSIIFLKFVRGLFLTWFAFICLTIGAFVAACLWF